MSGPICARNTQCIFVSCTYSVYARANKEHCKELEELKGRFQGEVMRERLRLEQDKEADLNKMRARLNQEKSVAEAKLQRGHSKYLEDMKKKMEEQRNDEEAKLAEEMQEKIRKVSLEV